MMKYIVGLIALILLAAGAYYFLTAAPAAEPTDNTPQEPAVMATSTYATSTFTAVYPRDFTVDENYFYQGVPNKPIAGVKFTIPMTMATGTNLSSDSYVSVEWLPRATLCTGDIFVLQNVRAESMTDEGRTYSHATTSGAAAGNLYEEHLYAFPNSKPCTAVRYYIHTTSLANYEPGVVQEYDRAKLLEAFDSIRRSVTLIPQTP